MGVSRGAHIERTAGAVLVVGAGPFQTGLVTEARDLGLNVVTVDRNADAPGMALADIACAVDVCDLEAVVDVARRHEVCGVVTAASDVALPATARVAEQLGLRGPTQERIDRCSDKLLAHAALRSADIAVPRTELLHSRDEAEARVRELPWERFVIKPRRGAGGRGVSICAPGDDLRRATSKATMHGGSREGFLLQEYIDGVSVGLEACFFGGRLVRAFVMDDQFLPGFVSPIGHSLPSSLPEPLRSAVVSEVERAAQILGLADGPANFDLRIRRGETVVLEVNPRLGGNSISELVHVAYGVSLYRAAVLVALGEDPSPALEPKRQKAAATRLLISPRHGVVHLRDALPTDFEAFCTDGEPTRLHVDEKAILGRAVCDAPTADEASARARDICARAGEAIGVESRSSTS